MWAAEGSRIEVIDEAARKLEKYLREDERVVNITTTIGSSPARYYVCTTPEMPNPAFGELILNVKKVKDVEKIGEKAFEYANKNLPGITVSIKKYPNGIPVSCPIELILNVKKVKDVEKIGEKAFEYANKNLPGITVSIKKYPNGIPVSCPIEVAFSGPDPQVLRKLSDKAADIMNKNLPGITVSIKKYPNGIPVSCPIEVAFSGPDPQVLRKLSDKAADIMKKYPEVLNLRTDWRNKIFAWEGNYSEADVKRAGLTSVDLATSIMRTTEGMPIGSIKKDDKLVSVILKEHRDEDKNDISDLEQAPVWGMTLESQPLSVLIKNGNIKFEEGQVWRRNRVRTMTVQGDIPVGASASDVRDKFKDEIESIELPKGYTMEWHGEYSEQKKNVISLIEAVPVPVIFMLRDKFKDEIESIELPKGYTMEWHGEYSEQKKNVISLIEAVPVPVIFMFLICVFLFASVKIPALIFSMLPLCMIGIVPGLFISCSCNIYVPYLCISFCQCKNTSTYIFNASFMYDRNCAGAFYNRKKFWIYVNGWCNFTFWNDDKKYDCSC